MNTLTCCGQQLLGTGHREHGSDMASFTNDIPDDGVKDKGETLQELKANMTEAITSALRSMKKESEEWGEKEMVIELSA